jgi:hypothetical protein
MANKRFPSRLHKSARSPGVGYAFADDIQLGVRDDGEWYLNWPKSEDRHLRGPDLASLHRGTGRRS